jgi:hypothetical protein
VVGSRFPEPIDLKLKQIKPDVSFQIVLIGQIPGQHEIRRMIKETNATLPVHALEYLPDNQISTFMNRATGFVLRGEV